VSAPASIRHVTDYFTEAIVGNSAAAADSRSSEDDNVLVSGIANDELALRIHGPGLFEQNKGKLKLVRIDDGKKTTGSPDPPSTQTVPDGTYQLSPGRSSSTSPEGQTNRAQVRSSVDAYFTIGKDLVSEVGYVPLTVRRFTSWRRSISPSAKSEQHREGPQRRRHTRKTAHQGAMKRSTAIEWRCPLALLSIEPRRHSSSGWRVETWEFLP